jgi:hypothetical protein
MKVIFAFIGCLLVQAAGAWQCDGEQDPYEIVKSAFDSSDIVFMGRIVERPSIRSDALLVAVEKKWKGPELRTVSLNYTWKPEQYSNLYFAARSDQPPGWISSFPICFPRDSSLTIEEILNEGAGVPVPPSERAMAVTSATFIAILVLACVGLALGQRALSWETPTRPRLKR